MGDLSQILCTVRTCLCPGARLLRSKDQCQWSQSSLPVLLHRLTSVNLVLSAGPGWPPSRSLQAGARGPVGLTGGVLCLLALLPAPSCVWRGRESRNVALALSQQLGSFLVAVNHSGQSYVFSGRCRVQPQHTEVKPGSVKPGDRRETGERRQ